MDIISIYITFSSKEEAKRVVQILLQEKLIACANLAPIESYYKWKGNAVCDDEWSAVTKTTSELWNTLQDRVSQLHSYEVPCIIRHNIEANEAYANWVKGEVVGAKEV